MEKDRIVKPISFNTVKDDDILSWIEHVEKSDKLNYSQYVKRLIQTDMLSRQNLSCQINTNVQPSSIDIERIIEETTRKVTASLSEHFDNKINNMNNMNNAANPIVVPIRENDIILSQPQTQIDDEAMSNLSDIMNGNF